MPERRTVLVTGANSGIGLATVVEAARKGLHPVGSVRSDEKARTVEEAAAEAGVSVETVLLDVTDADRCAEVIDGLRPWGLVNNAGFPLTGAIEDVGDDEAREALETMALAPMRLARLAVAHMRSRGGGRIVNVSSVYGRTATPLTGWYQAAKHALEAASDALRMEIARDGIAVCLVEPGGIRTALWDDAKEDIEARGGSRYEGAYRRSLQGIKLADPFMRRPEAVARVIVRALTAPIVRPRELVGVDARVAATWDAVVPDAVKDRITRLALGL